MARAFSSSSGRLRIAVCGCAASARTAIFGRPVWWRPEPCEGRPCGPGAPIIMLWAARWKSGAGCPARMGGVMDGGPWCEFRGNPAGDSDLMPATVPI